MEENKKLAALLKDIYEFLNGDLKEKAKACKNTEELVKLLGEAGIALPDEVLEAVAGGYKPSPSPVISGPIILGLGSDMQETGSDTQGAEHDVQTVGGVQPTDTGIGVQRGGDGKQNTGADTQEIWPLL